MAASGDDRTTRASGGAEVDRTVVPTVLWLWGEHDLTTAGSVTSALRRAGVDHDVVVDLAEVTFMDASTLRPLVHGRAALVGVGKRLLVRGPHENQRRLLEICELAELIEEDPAPALPREAAARTALATWIEVPSEVALPFLAPSTVDDPVAKRSSDDAPMNLRRIS